MDGAVVLYKPDLSVLNILQRLGFATFYIDANKISALGVTTFHSVESITVFRKGDGLYSLDLNPAIYGIRQLIAVLRSKYGKGFQRTNIFGKRIGRRKRDR
jgi:hypothetical protein